MYEKQSYLNTFFNQLMYEHFQKSIAETDSNLTNKKFNGKRYFAGLYLKGNWHDNKDIFKKIFRHRNSII